MSIAKKILLFIFICLLSTFMIARRINPLKHLGGLPITEAQILSTDWDYPSSAVPNPLYKMPFDFTDPISARLGMKLSF